MISPVTCFWNCGKGEVESNPESAFRARLLIGALSRVRRVEFVPNEASLKRSRVPGHPPDADVSFDHHRGCRMLTPSGIGESKRRGEVRLRHHSFTWVMPMNAACLPASSDFSRAFGHVCGSPSSRTLGGSRRDRRPAVRTGQSAREGRQSDHFGDAPAGRGLEQFCMEDVRDPIPAA